MPTPDQEPHHAVHRRSAAPLWLLAAALVVTTAVIAHAAARQPSHPRPASGHADGHTDPDPAVLRQIAWLMPRLASVRAQSAGPERKAAVLGTFVVATLTGALAVAFQYGLPTHPATRALALVWTGLVGLTLYHLGNVTEATIDTGVGFLADAISPAALRQRTITIADDLALQRDETITEVALLSLANKRKFRRYNRAKNAFHYSLLAATAAALATALAGRW